MGKYPTVAMSCCALARGQIRSTLRSTRASQSLYDSQLDGASSISAIEKPTRIKALVHPQRIAVRSAARVARLWSDTAVIIRSKTSASQSSRSAKTCKQA